MAEVEQGPWTVLRLIQWTGEYFARCGVDSPRLAAEVLLANALGCSRIQLYARYAEEPHAARREAFKDLVRRAAAGEPVAYLIGSKEFYSLSFKVTPDVLIPRPETEILVSEAVSHVRQLGREARVWDACTGSGCVAVAIARQCPQARVLATDVSEPALAVAGENILAHELADRVQTLRADLLDLPAETPLGGPFDVICANPPYVGDREPVADVVHREPALALRGGADGLDLIRRLIPQAPGHLAAGGILVLEFGYTQAEAVFDLLMGCDAFLEPRLICDHQGIERTAVAERV
jgi:release factor glutamine methyltransferase